MYLYIYIYFFIYLWNKCVYGTDFVDVFPESLELHRTYGIHFISNRCKCVNFHPDTNRCVKFHSHKLKCCRHEYVRDAQEFFLLGHALRAVVPLVCEWFSSKCSDSDYRKARTYSATCFQPEANRGVAFQ
jgi:hypothetical protein